MPQRNNDILASLRSIVDAGGPQKPVKSHSGGPGSISAPSGLEKPVPMGDEPLAAGKSFTDFLTDHTPVGWFGDLNNPLEAMSPPIGRLGKADLPMDEASRMARAAKQGYVHDVYHGTLKNFDEFSGPVKYGSYGEGDFGIHVASDPAAANKATGADSMVGLGPMQVHPAQVGAQVLPLKARMSKTLELPDIGIWRSPDEWANLSDDYVANHADSPLLNELTNEAKRYSQFQRNMVESGQGSLSGLDNPWQVKLKGMLEDAGYDSIKYPNFTESDGAPSYLLLNPNQLRSRFAAFDPTKRNSRNLLAGLAGMMALGHEKDE